MKFVLQSIAALLIATIASSVDAGQLLREFKGTGNTTTAEFSVESPWIIDWRVDSDFENQVALDLILIDAVSGRFVGAVKSGPKKRISGRSNGVRLFQTGGRYKLRVSSSLARWTIKVEQLTKEEAELYTPRNAS
jgi:hypothetical protein